MLTWPHEGCFMSGLSSTGPLSLVHETQRDKPGLSLDGDPSRKANPEICDISMYMGHIANMA